MNRRCKTCDASTFTPLRAVDTAPVSPEVQRPRSPLLQFGGTEGVSLVGGHDQWCAGNGRVGFDRRRQGKAIHSGHLHIHRLSPTVCLLGRRFEIGRGLRHRCPRSPESDDSGFGDRWRRHRRLLFQLGSEPKGGTPAKFAADADFPVHEGD
jgi:hypothetical protein